MEREGSSAFERRLAVITALCIVAFMAFQVAILLGYFHYTD